MKTGRNDPCPCGSGKKYKRCCLNKDQAARAGDSEWQQLRRAEGEIVYRLLDEAHEWYGPNFLDDAWTEYTRMCDEPLAIGEAKEAQTSFVPWSVFTYVPRSDDDSLPRVPVALTYFFAAEDVALDEKQFILEMLRQPYSFWSVQEVQPGTSLKLRDIFTHIEHTVRERQGSEILKKGDIVYTRVISMGHTAIMVGMAPYPFPPNFHFHVLDARQMCFGARRQIEPVELHAYEPLLRQFYFRLKQGLLNPVMPVLQNTDGDPLEFITLTYKPSCSPQTAFERLRDLNPIESEESLLSDSEMNANGTLRKVNFSWMIKGNKQHRSWDNTVLGEITIEDEQLVVQVNSTKRSQKIQTEIAERLSDSAVLLETVAESLAEKLAKAEGGKDMEPPRREREEREAFAALPEVQAQLKEMMKQRWDDWLDEPVPVLEGKTPRQAARSAAGRERLEALLIDFERQAETDDPALAPDVAELRKQLRIIQGATKRKATHRSTAVTEVSQLDGVQLYQLKITLKRSDPAIWRRIIVRSDMPLNRLHGVVQRVMGWTDSHLHHFIVGRTFYGTPDPDIMGFGSQTRNEKRYTVADVAPVAKRSFIYEYDFGDGWEHKIVLEKILPPDPSFRHPVCLAGANACPPEDCGGISGYYQMLEILGDSNHEEHESMKEWVGAYFDLASFDLDRTNAILNRMKA